jgi:tRNA (mo5U34)-methyltransferase
MEENKFQNCRVVDISVTSVKEQRSSNWMKFESLSNFLDETNSRLTVEGYPAPIRAVFIAEA